MSKILDSGDRTQFDTGAVRDMREGKGRCDLLPLDVAAILLEGIADGETSPLLWLNRFQSTGKPTYLREALMAFLRNDRAFNNDKANMLLEVAKHFEEGAGKYGENNWQKGIPVKVYIDSAVRHYLKRRRGDQDEPHDRAFCWNIMCAWWTCTHKPELNDYAKSES